MNITLRRIEDFEGEFGNVYSVIIEGEEYTELTKFFNSEEIYNYDTSAFQVIHERLLHMVEKSGFKEHYLPPTGSKDDHGRELKAKGLRLYCLRFSNTLAIFSGGGIKPEDVRTYQEKPDLNFHVELLQSIQVAFDREIKEGNIHVNNQSEIVSESGEISFEIDFDLNNYK